MVNQTSIVALFVIFKGLFYLCKAMKTYHEYPVFIAGN